MDVRSKYAACTREHLLDVIEALHAENETLRRRLEELEGVVKKLGTQLSEAQRASHRQAAPFSKGKSKTPRNKPGRKGGKGRFSFRKPPEPEELSGPPVDVPVEQARCACGGELEDDGVEMVWNTDIPAVPKPIVTAYKIHKCRCRKCGLQLRGKHPEVAPDQQGATAHRLSPRVLATGHVLHYDIGIPMRKVPEVLKLLTGVPVTQGALTADALRRAKAEIGDAYESLRQNVRSRVRVNTDDTGWKIGGENAFLMGFDTDEETVFQIRSRHRNEEVREVVPGDYEGVMGTDRGPSYDAEELSGVKQQKCLSHVQRSISAVLEKKKGGARRFGETLKALLKAALRLWHEQREGTLSEAEYREQGKEVKAAVTRHLRERQLQDEDNQRLLNELGWHHDRGNLLRFLDEPAVEPTNNRAERALRPGVIARKVSQCSKTPAGARATEAFKSVFRTMRKRGVDVIEGTVALMRGGKLEELAPG